MVEEFPVIDDNSIQRCDESDVKRDGRSKKLLRDLLPGVVDTFSKSHPIVSDYVI